MTYRVSKALFCSCFVLLLSACSGSGIFKETTNEQPSSPVEIEVQPSDIDEIEVTQSSSSDPSELSSQSEGSIQSSQSSELSSEGAEEEGEIDEIIEEQSISEVSDEPQEWLPYRHEVLGISLQYLSSWGEPHTSPVANITHLPGLVDRYTNNSNVYAHGPTLGFIGGGDNPSIQLFDDAYQGSPFPNGRTYGMGPQDTFLELKKTGDICDYTFYFDKRPDFPHHLDEVESDCSDGVQIVLARTTQYFGGDVGTLYNYRLDGYGYARLENKNFDHVLASYHMGGMQVPIGDMDIESFLAHHKSGTSQKEFDRKKQELTSFVESIDSFTPVESELPAWEEVDDEHHDIRTLRSFYHFLEIGDLESAYELYSVQKVGIVKFTDWYGKVMRARPHDFTVIEPRTYRYFVEYQDHNANPEAYWVTARVDDDGKFETLASEKLESEIVISEDGDRSVYTMKRLEVSSIIFIDGEETYVIDETEPDSLGALGFRRPHFSSSERYIIYDTTGWESHGYAVYDTLEHEIAIESGGGNTKLFTSDESHFINCDNPGMSDSYGHVYRTSDWKLLFDATDKVKEYYGEILCELQDNDSFVRFTFMNSYDEIFNSDNVVAIIEYDLASGDAWRVEVSQE